jgi:hypothetical protein
MDSNESGFLSRLLKAIFCIAIHSSVKLNGPRLNRNPSFFVKKYQENLCIKKIKNIKKVA